MGHVRTKQGFCFSITALVALLLLPTIAGAGGGTFPDSTDDVFYYDWESDSGHLDQDWDEVDIWQVGVTTSTSAIQVTTRVVDLHEGWWTAHEVAYDVTGDGIEDFDLLVTPDGSAELLKVRGWEDTGYVTPCGGIGHTVDYTRNEITTLVPRSCLANTGGAAISVWMYDDEGYSCDCNDFVLDTYPNEAGTYSPTIPYEGTTTPPPTSPTYDPNGVTGTIYRLYRAYFLREPDRKGYDYWLGVYRNGYPLDKISNDFARSAEFQSQYGTLDNAQFLNRVYGNVLGRSPEPEGYDYWMDQMNRGMLRGFVMIYFSDSEEFRSQTAAGRPPGY